jgi:F-type H+-transporting ATPase subunit a
LAETSKWRWGKKRWIVLLFIVLGAIAASVFPPIRPHIQVAPERLSHDPVFSAPLLGDFYITNTLIASVLVYLLLIVIAYFVRRAALSGELVPRGLPGALEALLEALYNLTESTAGRKWARSIFPWFATIVLVVLLANWMELIPGVDSIGWLEHSDHGFEAREVLPGLYGLVGTEEVDNGYLIVPWVRVASTDLNFTLALALISVGMTQVIGVRARGPRYFSKFFNTTTLFNKPLFGTIDFLVGILETISEFAKILSFSFRLFGVIFAGTVLLFLVGTMVPIFAQSAVLMFEFFIGLIQAMVFGMLTMIFMAQAVHGHGDEHEETH